LNYDADNNIVAIEILQASKKLLPAKVEYMNMPTAPGKYDTGLLERFDYVGAIRSWRIIKFVTAI